MLVEAKDKSLFAVILESFDGEAPSAKGLFRAPHVFTRAVSGAGLGRVRIPPLSAFNTPQAQR